MIINKSYGKFHHIQVIFKSLIVVHVNIGVINTDTEPTVLKKAAAIHMYNKQPKSTSPSPCWSSHISLCSILWVVLEKLKL